VADSGVSERLKAVREATGLTQARFLPRLNQAAERLGVREYSQSTLSRLESGMQTASFDDVAVFAAVDPLQRGKLWLAWGEEVVSATNHHTYTAEELDAAARQAEKDRRARVGGAHPKKPRAAGGH
jgi:transcriptional regulator with XRE-family HTH domain